MYINELASKALVLNSGLTQERDIAVRKGGLKMEDSLERYF